MLEPDHEMDRIVAHLVRRYFRFEIKAPETAAATPGDIQFWIQIENTLARAIDNSQIRITRSLHFIGGRVRKITAQTGRAIEQVSQHVFEMTADFIDTQNRLNRVVIGVHSFHHFIQDLPDRIPDSAIHRVIWIESQNLFACGIEDHVTKRDTTKLPIFVEQPWD
jgi:hypothetical protein